MLDGLAPDLAPRLFIAIGGVALAFLVLIAVLLFLRRRNAPLFIKGGRAREHRLLVLDAAAVDAKRRLVLIRRDDTEHLIMIGGPTDIVIETGIGGARVAGASSSAERQPQALEVAAAQPAASVKPAAAARPEQPAPAAARSQQIEARRVAPARAEGLDRRNGRASEVAEKAVAPASTVSAMASVLYDETHEPAADTRSVQKQPGVAATGSAGAIRQPEAAARHVEDVLDEARERVLSPAALQASANDEAIRALQEQLEVSKAEAAAKAEAERMEAERQAAERAATAKAEAAHAEAARLEARRAEAQRLEAERAEAAVAEAERIKVEKENAARAEAERLAAARAEAMARFEAARRAQTEQRVTAAQASVTQPEAAAHQAIVRPAQWPLVEPPVAEPAMRAAENLDAADAGKNHERLASDFERLLEAELEADGVLDNYHAPSVSADRNDAFTAPSVNPVRRDSQPITGAIPGVSIEQDMARRLGEISLTKKSDAR